MSDQTRQLEPTSPPASPYRARRPSRFAAAAAIGALLATPVAPAQAQVAETVENLGSASSNFKDIADSIELLEEADASRWLKQFKTIAGSIGDLAPYLGLISVIINFSQLGEESDTEIILKEFKKTNAKIDNLGAQLQNAVQALDTSIYVNTREGFIEDYRDQLDAAEDDMALFTTAGGAGAAPRKVLERDTSLFSNASKAAHNRCTGIFMEKAAEKYNGNLNELGALSIYLLQVIRKANLLEGQYHIVKGTLDNPSNLTKDQIKAQAVQFQTIHETRAQQCATAVAAILAKYKRDRKQMESAVAFLKTTLGGDTTAESVVAALGRKYPYLDWVALKFEKPDYRAEAESYYMLNSGRMTMVPGGTAGKWSVVLGFYEKGSRVAAQGYKQGDCLGAFGSLASGIPSNGPNGTTYSVPWGEGNLAGSDGWFTKQCMGRQPDSMFLALTGQDISFAASNPASVSRDPSLSDYRASSPGAFFFDGLNHAYLVMPPVLKKNDPGVEIALKPFQLVNVQSGQPLQPAVTGAVLPIFKNIPHMTAIPVPIPGESEYRLQFLPSGQYLQAQDDGSVVVTNLDLTAGVVGKWAFEREKDAPAGQYRVCEQERDYCLFMQNGQAMVGKIAPGNASARWILK